MKCPHPARKVAHQSISSPGLWYYPHSTVPRLLPLTSEEITPEADIKRLGNAKITQQSISNSFHKLWYTVFHQLDPKDKNLEVNQPEKSFYFAQREQIQTHNAILKWLLLTTVEQMLTKPSIQNLLIAKYFKIVLASLLFSNGCSPL